MFRRGFPLLPPRKHVHLTAFCDVIMVWILIWGFLPIWFSFLRWECVHIFLRWTSIQCSYLHVLFLRMHLFSWNLGITEGKVGRGNSDAWIGEGRDGGELDQKKLWTTRSISLPSGNSGNGIGSRCKVWPRGQSYIRPLGPQHPASLTSTTW